jgi:VWFA-related protein
MRRHILILLLFLGAAGAGGSVSPVRAPAAQSAAGQPAVQPVGSPEVIKTESQMVLVDVIATDKKDHHLTDLTAKDFRLYDDDKEQTISSFSHVTGGPEAGDAKGRRYIVLFFDNSTMSGSDQTVARKAAGEFVTQSAPQGREMSVVEFTGITRVAVNFTTDANALKSAVEGVKFGMLQPNMPGQTSEIASMGGPSGVQIQSDFAARSILLAIRGLCRSLRSIAGRKTVILFSGGFPLNSERETELSATIDAANKANVAIYPVDVRGLQGLQAPGIMNNPSDMPQVPGMPRGATRQGSPLPHEAVLLASLWEVIPRSGGLAQHPGGGGGAGGGASGGSSSGSGSSAGGAGTHGGGGTPSGGFGGTRGTSGAGNVGPRGGFGAGQPGFGNSPNGILPGSLRNSPQYPIIPPPLENLSRNQQVLYALAQGTGGFVIVNTNDFKTGLDKIARDMDDYYILGYVPPHPLHDGSYHKIKVKVDRHGVEVRARNGYFDVKSPDLLAGKPEGKVLEEHAESPAPGDFPVSVSAPFFYTAPHVARVNLAIQMPSHDIAFAKQKGKFHAEINVLGIAYRPDGSVAARFSDTVKNDFEKKEMKEALKTPFAYQNNFDIAPGQYDLKIVMSAGGEKFGKFEKRLSITSFSGSQFSMSDVVFSREMRPTSALLASLDTQLLEERTPLVYKGMEIIPAADHNFDKKREIVLYCEVYEPDQIVNGRPRVGIIVDIFNHQTNQRVFTTNTILVTQNATEGSPVIPVAVRLPDETLPPGDYRLEVHALDSFGHKSPTRAKEFVLK